MSNTSKFRILALDGGGIKGTFSAAVLAAWERDTLLRIQDHFDLITGTSTGGILAVGLHVAGHAWEPVKCHEPEAIRWRSLRFKESN